MLKGFNQAILLIFALIALSSSTQTPQILLINDIPKDCSTLKVRDLLMMNCPKEVNIFVLANNKLELVHRVGFENINLIRPQIVLFHQNFVLLFRDQFFYILNSQEITINDPTPPVMTKIELNYDPLHSVKVINDHIFYKRIGSCQIESLFIKIENLQKMSISKHSSNLFDYSTNVDCFLQFEAFDQEKAQIYNLSYDMGIIVYLQDFSLFFSKLFRMNQVESNPNLSQLTLIEEQNGIFQYDITLLGNIQSSLQLYIQSQFIILHYQKQQTENNVQSECILGLYFDLQQQMVPSFHQCEESIEYQILPLPQTYQTFYVATITKDTTLKRKVHLYEVLQPFQKLKFELNQINEFSFMILNSTLTNFQISIADYSSVFPIITTTPYVNTQTTIKLSSPSDLCNTFKTNFEASFNQYPVQYKFFKPYCSNVKKETCQSFLQRKQLTEGKPICYNFYQQFLSSNKNECQGFSSHLVCTAFQKPSIYKLENQNFSLCRPLELIDKYTFKINPNPQLKSEKTCIYTLGIPSNIGNSIQQAYVLRLEDSKNRPINIQKFEQQNIVLQKTSYEQLSSGSSIGMLLEIPRIQIQVPFSPIYSREVIIRILPKDQLNYFYSQCSTCIESQSSYKQWDFQSQLCINPNSLNLSNTTSYVVKLNTFKSLLDCSRAFLNKTICPTLSLGQTAVLDSQIIKNPYCSVTIKAKEGNSIKIQAVMNEHDQIYAPLNSRASISMQSLPKDNPIKMQQIIIPQGEDFEIMFQKSLNKDSSSVSSVIQISYQTSQATANQTTESSKNKGGNSNTIIYVFIGLAVMIFCVCFKFMNPFQERDLKKKKKRKAKKRSLPLETTVMSDSDANEPMPRVSIDQISDYVSIYKQMGLVRNTEKFLNLNENQLATFRELSDAEFITTYMKIVPEEQVCILCNEPTKTREFRIFLCGRHFAHIDCFDAWFKIQQDLNKNDLCSDKCNTICRSQTDDLVIQNRTGPGKIIRGRGNSQLRRYTEKSFFNNSPKLDNQLEEIQLDQDNSQFQLNLDMSQDGNKSISYASELNLSQIRERSTSNIQTHFSPPSGPSNVIGGKMVMGVRARSQTNTNVIPDKSTMHDGVRIGSLSNNLTSSINKNRSINTIQQSPKKRGSKGTEGSTKLASLTSFPGQVQDVEIESEFDDDELDSEIDYNTEHNLKPDTLIIQEEDIEDQQIEMLEMPKLVYDNSAVVVEEVESVN